MEATPKAIKIRKMLPEDLGTIIEIDKKIGGKERAPSWPQKVTSHLQTYYPPLCHVAEVEGNVVGFILGDMRGSEHALPLSGWINIVGIDPAYQHQGIGRRLIQAFAEECRRNGVKARIIIRENDETVVKLFHSIGFRRGQLIDLEMP